MNSAIAASNPLQHAREQAPAFEEQVALGRSLLLIPLLAGAAWAITIGLIWLGWQSLT